MLSKILFLISFFWRPLLCLYIKMRSKFMVGGVVVLCGAAVWLFSYLYKELQNLYEQSAAVTDLEYSWVFRLLLNLVGYSTVLVPGFILYKYLDKTNYFDKTLSNSWLYRILYAWFGPHERLPESEAPRAGAAGGAGAGAPRDLRREGAELVFCFSCLMGAYLVWGLLQEKIMTQSYLMPDGRSARFTDSQLLVFANRLAALVAVAAGLACTGRLALAAPLHEFTYCALSNVVSAWCQYEALKYVSFPTQVLSKSCKVVAVMAMSTAVSRTRHAPHEYLAALAISAGMALFLLGSHRDDAAAPHAPGSGWSGAALLALYLASDAFTSSWQAALFARRRVSPLQMLCAVNLSACLVTAAALASRAAPDLALLRHPQFARDAAALSACSALGQLAIYRTVARFGAVAFAVMMTVRQAVSVLLSCLVYRHRVSASGAAGVLLVFAAVLLRVYWPHRARRPPH